MHPFQYSLKLLEHEINTAPSWFPQERQGAMLESLKAYELNPDMSREELDNVIITFGKEIWPYRKAMGVMHEKYAAPREEKIVREALAGKNLLKRFEQYIQDGGTISDFKQGKKFETFFTPDERVELIAAYLEAHDQVMKEFEETCISTQKGECDELVKKFMDEQPQMEVAIEELRVLGTKSEKWREEILEEVRVLEEGWSTEEQDFSLADIQKTIEFYRDTIAADKNWRGQDQVVTSIASPKL